MLVIRLGCRRVKPVTRLLITVDRLELVLIGGRTILRRTVVQLAVDREAEQGRNDSVVERAEEHHRDHQSDDGDDDDWTVDEADLLGICREGVMKQQVAGTGVGGDDTEAAHKDKHLADGNRHVELNAVLQVEDEAVPGRRAVRVARDAHHSVAKGRQILNQSLEAVEAARNEATDDFGDSVIAILHGRLCSLVNHMDNNKHGVDS